MLDPNLLSSFAIPATPCSANSSPQEHNNTIHEGLRATNGISPSIESDAGLRLSHEPTIFQAFTKSNLDWCRFCGVTMITQTAAFRPGPWGKRTLCKY